MEIHFASFELAYIISEAIAIIQCKGYGEIMLGYQPIHGLQILSFLPGPYLFFFFVFFFSFARAHPHNH